MSILPIVYHPDPRLKKVCTPIEVVDADIQKLAENMLETMYDAPGIGLAAPQIGVLKRVFVMDCSNAEEEDAPIVLINPEITWSSEEENTYQEGCLSLPELFEDVTRPKMVRMRFLDLDGKENELELDALEATCAQHELDHLNGKLFIDHLSNLKRSMLTKKMIKYKKEFGLS